MTDVIAPRVRAVENMVARAQAVTQRGGTQGACMTCQAKLWVTFFFDGTGNHKELHFPRQHTNVAALVDAHERDPENGVETFYYEGIGMPFEFKERIETTILNTRAGPMRRERAGHKEGESTWNKAFGTEIDKRLEKAMFDFQIFVESWRRRRRVDEINIAAFGFSRGATTARAFMHWLMGNSKVSFSDATVRYDGIPVNVRFLGLFDTVESIGAAGTNKEPDLIKTSLPAFVKKAFHVIGAHELRHAFPITVLGTDRHKQVVYPGAHADIGGGYADAEQLRRNTLPRVGLLQMLDEARGAGLKMQSIGEMQADRIGWNGKFKFSFSVEQATKNAFLAYMKHVKTQAGPIEAVFQSHCALYRQWIDAGLAMEDVRQNLTSARSRSAGTAHVNEALVQQHLLSNLARTPRGRGATVAGGPLRGEVAPEVEDFFENYVHDSFQHFSLSGGTMQSDFTNANYYKNREVRYPRA